MALTITHERTVRMGPLKVIYFKVVDAGPAGGTLDVSTHLNHLLWANAIDITNGAKVTTVWTDDAESITLGAAGSDGAVVKVKVEGW